MRPSAFAVVGAGLAGAATAWQLARRGHEVAVVERAEPAHRGGSSHGSARIFRYGYPDLFYVRLVQDARVGWSELEALSGRQLIAPTGALDLGDLRDPGGLALVLAQAGVEHELVCAAEAEQRWPQVRTDGTVLWHPGAGVIDADGAVEAMLALAVAAGAQLQTQWAMSTVHRTDAGFRLTSTDGRSLETGHVVVAAGGWLPELLPLLPVTSGFLSRFPVLQVRQEQAFHFPYRPELLPGAGEPPWPSIIHKSREIQTYALQGGRDADFRGHKVAEYNAGKVIASAADQDQTIDVAKLARLVAHVERSLPGLVPEPYAGTTCIFTNTPTEDFVVDGTDGITVVSPCSGHGAKFAPVIGALAADVATGTSPALPRFSVSRP